MTSKNLEQMKKLIEEKKNKTLNDTQLRPNNKKEGASKKRAFNNQKSGGFFDK